MGDDPAPLVTWRNPAPVDEQSISERKYKRVVGYILHNQPAKTHAVKTNFSRSYSKRDFRGVFKRAIDNGHVRRRREGWVVAECVE